MMNGRFVHSRRRSLTLLRSAKRRLCIAVTLSLLALPRHGAAEEGEHLSRHDAPLGLTFGMAPSEVSFNEIGRPTPPERPEKKVNPNLGLPSIYLPTAEERSQQDTYQRVLKCYEEIVAGCEMTFDAIHSTSAGDTAWVTWEEDRLLYEETATLSPLQILGEEEELLFKMLKDEMEARGYPRASEFRTLSVYEFESAGRKRRACLIFGQDGLTHIFMPAIDFRDVWDEIHESIRDNVSYEVYSSRRVRTQQNPSFPWDEYQVFVDRNYWIDGDRKVLVLSKDYELVLGTLARAWAFFASKDFFDGDLPSFLSYTDLARRAGIFETYREKALPVLRQALSDAADATRTVQERKAAIERAKEEKQRSETEELLDGFR